MRCFAVLKHRTVGLAAGALTLALAIVSVLPLALDSPCLGCSLRRVGSAVFGDSLGLLDSSMQVSAPHLAGALVLHAVDTASTGCSICVNISRSVVNTQ
ncbi:uncharacterized protein B0H18DRAFT_1005048 [Fomitopsis serialis]|uniref:uncharacterized protein n=1 Tax=Fomitopsis serialis TaxID=139415 RepID=UPI002007F7E0|nr:uncharacterized protein B0H18DRAFT_1005048 [Neoantrodia serialis]KAH9926675.1 hypothetical protein B0H18DRAFT_1005048 [Neoantrodia serialis]